MQKNTISSIFVPFLAMCLKVNIKLFFAYHFSCEAIYLIVFFFYFQAKETDIPEFEVFFDKVDTLLNEWGKDPFGANLEII